MKWLPDVDPTTPGIYTDVNGMYPTSDGGYATVPVSNGTSTLSDTSTQSAAPYGGLVRYLDGSAKLIWNVSATGNKIYENTTDVTGTAATLRAVGMYGNVCIITQGRSLNVKSKTGTGGTFADLAGSPPDSDFIAINSLAVMLLSYNDGTDTPDGWWASDIGDHTTWTPASSNQAANGRLLEAPGPIRGAITFKDAIYVFKDSAVFVGRYVGRPLIWQWKLLRSDIGCSHQEAILTDGERLYFIGKQGAYAFDGFNFQRIDSGVWDVGIAPNFIFEIVSAGGKVFGFYDEHTKCCVWHTYYGLGGREYYYNTRSGNWGTGGTDCAGISGQRASGAPYPWSRGMAIDAGAFFGGQYGDPSWPLFADDDKAYNRSTTIASAEAKPTCYVTTGRYGDYRKMTEVKRVIPHIVWDGHFGTAENNGASATFTMTPYTADSAVEALTAGTDVSSSTDLKRFDYLKTARFHAAKISNATHSWKITDIEVDAKLSGTD